MKSSRESQYRIRIRVDDLSDIVEMLEKEEGVEK